MTVEEVYKKIIESEDLKKAAIDAIKSNSLDKFLKENDFDVTLDQIKEFFDNKNNEELTNEELNMVAGGVDFCDVAFSVGTIIFGCVISALANPDQDHTYDC